MTERQREKSARNARVCEAFRTALKKNPRRSDAAIIADVLPQFPDIKSPVTIRNIVGRAGLLNVQV